MTTYGCVVDNYATYCTSNVAKCTNDATVSSYCTSGFAKNCIANPNYCDVTNAAICGATSAQCNVVATACANP